MRILIVKLGAIGDVAHTLPAVAALRCAHPQAHLAWAVERGGAANLLAGSPVLDELIELPLRAWRKTLPQAATWRAIGAAVRELRARRFDLALDFQGLLKSGLVARLAGAPRRIGFARAALREPLSAQFLTEQVAVDDGGHIIEKNLQLARALGAQWQTGQYEFPLALSAADEAFAARHAQQPFAILNPGGGWPTKLWHTAGFAQIADRLWQAHGLRSFITYGPGELALAEAICAASAHAARANALQPLDASLKEFVALAKRAQLFLGGDTGPMHLAAAVATPIVTFFGPTSAARNGPFAQADVVVARTDLSCRVDCYRRACSHMSCMDLPVGQMWAAVERRLATAHQVKALTVTGAKNF